MPNCDDLIRSHDKYYPHIRDAFELAHGPCNIGDYVTNQIVYVGIHQDERDLEWKEWYSTSTPLRIATDGRLSPIFVAHSDAQKLITLEMNEGWELPPANVLSFMLQNLPCMMVPKLSEPVPIIGIGQTKILADNSQIQSQTTPNRVEPQIVRLYDEDDLIYLCQKSEGYETDHNMRGLIMPVMSRPMKVPSLD